MAKITIGRTLSSSTDSVAVPGVATDAGLASIFARQADGSQHAVIDSSALPAGAATSANQATANASLASIDGKTPALVSGRQPVDGSGVTQPISAVSLPLPAGAATSAKQDTGNASLASIDGKITAVNTGAVVVSSSALPTGAATSANQTTANTSLASLDGKAPALVAGRVPVDGSGVTQPVSAASLPLPSGAATSANQTATQPRDVTDRAARLLGHVTVDNASLAVTGTFWQATQPVSAASLPLPSGAATEATLALIKAKTDNLDVALSTRAVTGLTDAQLRASAVATSAQETNAATSNIVRQAASTTSAQLFAARTNRRGMIVVNESTSAIVYLKFGTTASTTSYTVAIPAGGTYEMLGGAYTGRVDIIWSSTVGSGSAQATETYV